MRVIIVPTDFSENAFNALRCAQQYFKYEKSKFILVHTYADEVYENKEVLSRDILEEYKAVKHKETEASLALVLERAMGLEPNPHHTFESKAIFGTLLDEVNSLVNSKNADLIVMGSQGNSAHRSITYGSNTLQVIKYVKCPVLGIPLGYKYERPERILFPSELLIPYKNRELKLLSCLAKSYRSELHLLYISNFDRLSLRQEDVKSGWEYRFRESEQTYTRHDEGDIAQIINEHISSNKIDMVVLVNSKHTYMETLLHTSTIDTVGLNTKIPFLILQNLSR
ncbi:universal stress protein [Dokdonia sp. 4H-3-7-5]|uniref:universal stress protein n=1 Tax=Dokdonia sp. (strain 4H-3-7-5) TaxID=983548 RepID=UPI00020A7356|nr:universal stress protein [Dokdonia sp. 4H-3-7-5]AEE20330.1 UspA domain-containing protein [Dokdonia sp. 4H-3-7-5]